MEKKHTMPLAPILSSLAILSFKKKSKGELGDLSGSMDDLNLDGGTLSLSDLGSMGGKKKSEPKSEGKSDAKLDGLNDALLSMSPPRDDRKINDIEASINDLKKHAESSDNNSKVTKGELESMKKDLSQINDSIKSLLNVYEAVSRQYNPFVDSVEDAPHVTSAEIAAAIPPRPEELAPIKKEAKPEPSKKLPLYNEALAELHALDLNEPLDRIVKPNDDEDEPSHSEEDTPKEKGTYSLSSMGSLGSLSLDVPQEYPEEAPIPRPMAMVNDTFALDQFKKLIDHQIEKIYKAKLMGQTLDASDMEMLDRWLSEFKHLGGS